jgi:hypothetical protein
LKIFMAGHRALPSHGYTRGTIYLLDESTTIVYDYETEEEIGRRTKNRT